LRTTFAAIALLFTTAVLAEDPSISLAWKNIQIADVHTKEGQAPGTHKAGAVHISLSQGELTSDFTGIQIVDGAIHVQSASAQLRYDNVSAKNVAILEVPKFLGGRKTVETHLYSFNNPAITATMKNASAWKISLPDDVELEYRRAADGATSLAFKDSKLVVTKLHEAIEAGFSDASLEKLVKIEPKNVPGEIKFLIDLKMKDERPKIFSTIRGALREEVAKAEFLQRIEVEMSKQLPVLPIELGGKLDGIWHLKPNADGMMSVTFGGRSAEALLAKQNAAEQFVSVANGPGLDLIVGLLFDTLSRVNPAILGRGFEVDADSGVMSYVPQSDDERAQLAMIAGQLVGSPVDAKDMTTLGIDLKGKQAKRQIRFLEEKGKGILQVRLGLVVRVKNADETVVPTLWNFSTGLQGNLILDQITIEKKIETVNSAFALFQKIEGSFKSNMARFLINQRLDQFQKANAKARTRFVIDRLNENELGLRLSLLE